MSATLPEYDELPYDSVPLPETDPDYLAALARLAGHDPPEPAHARVLELGCACGGNLLPLAHYAPGRQCVGIELSSVQAEAGRAMAATAGLANADILHGDLREAVGTLGEFDYIIAHGVYSWVPAQVREALLALCGRHLSPGGVAYVSYNVWPGWRSRQVLRESLRRETRGAGALPLRVTAARERLERWAADPAEFGAWPDLPAEIEFLLRASPSYLAHEYLADINEPVTVSEFAGQAAAHGLVPFGDAGARLNLSATLPWNTAEQQAIDDGGAVRFRRTLLVRADAGRRRKAAARLDQLAFHGRVSCDEEVDLSAPVPQTFITLRGGRVTVAGPLSKAALMVLAAVYPDCMTWSELRAAARDLFAQWGEAASGGDLPGFEREWIALVADQAVTPVAVAGGFGPARGDRPAAHRLARAQAAAGWPVIAGAHQVGLDVDEAARHLIGLLDGYRDPGQITNAQKDFCTRSGFAVADGTIRAAVHALLELFRLHGLLVPD